MPRSSKSSTPPREPARPRTNLRPVWSGHLKLALVTVPVIVVSATKTEQRLAFHQVHAPSGKRVRHEKTVPGVGAVSADEIQKGYEISKGRYVLFKPEEIEDLKIEARRSLEIVQSVEQSEIDPVWFEKPYYVLPDGDIALEPYTVLRDALRATKRIGIGQFVMRGRDYIGALKPVGSGILLETLRFHNEVKSADDVFEHVETATPDRELLELAAELIKRKAAPFDPAVFEDRYEKAVRELVEQRSRGANVVDISETKRAPAGGQVIDLIEALKRSVAEASGKKSEPKTKKAG